MSHTEQMREAFERHMSDGGKFPKAVERSGDGYRLLQTQNAWDAWKACAAAIIAKTTTENTPKGMLSTTCPWCESGFAFEAPALTTPAAEVPEAMGDAERDALIDAKLQEYGYPANARNAARAGWYAHAQWQSTRLRAAAVPSLQPVCRYISDVLAGDASSGEKHIARTIMHLLPLAEVMAAPQTQAAALDAGVVRELPGAAREEWQKVVRIAAQVSASSMVPVKAHALTAVDECFRAAMSAQAGNGGAA